MLTAQQAAERIGVTRNRVYQFIYEGRLPATKWGRDWMVTSQDVDEFVRQPTGYPKGRPRGEGGETAT